MSRLMLKFVRFRTPIGGFTVRYVNTYDFKFTEKDVEEVKIPVPWGHISGKWWGNKDVPPVVAIHGWQENANSFDKLIPLLNLPSVLAIDLPGHGISSHLPAGFFYDYWETIMMIHRIKMHFNWMQVPLLTHSYGSTLGYAFSAIFPDNVKWLISIECIRGLLVLYTEDYPSNLAKTVDEFLEAEKRDLHPSYKLSKLIEMNIEGSLGSVLYPETALTLLKRETLLADKPVEQTETGSSGMKIFFVKEKSIASKLPKEKQEDVEKFFLTSKEVLERAKENLKKFSLDEGQDKYYSIARDPRLRFLIPQAWDEEFVLKAAQYIKCPVLSVRAKKGFLLGSTKKLYEKSVDVLKKHSPNFEHHDIDGTHHVHLNEPDHLGQIINNFLKKL